MWIIAFDLIEHSVSSNIGEHRSTVVIQHHREHSLTLKRFKYFMVILKHCVIAYPSVTMLDLHYCFFEILFKKLPHCRGKNSQGRTIIKNIGSV